MLFLLQNSTIFTVGLESMRENYVSSSVWVMRMGLEDGWSDRLMIEVSVDTYLDLVSVDFDSTLDGLFHMFCVEVAETEMFHSAVLLQVFHCINILGVIVLFDIIVSDRSRVCMLGVC